MSVKTLTVLGIRSAKNGVLNEAMVLDIIRAEEAPFHEVKAQVIKADDKVLGLSLDHLMSMVALLDIAAPGSAQLTILLEDGAVSPAGDLVWESLEDQIGRAHV